VSSYESSPQSGSGFMSPLQARSANSQVLTSPLQSASSTFARQVQSTGTSRLVRLVASVTGIVSWCDLSTIFSDVIQ
jgi:hypothetical protein